MPDDGEALRIRADARVLGASLKAERAPTIGSAPADFVAAWTKVMNPDRFDLAGSLGRGTKFRFSFGMEADEDTGPLAAKSQTDPPHVQSLSRDRRPGAYQNALWIAEFLLPLRNQPGGAGTIDDRNAIRVNNRKGHPRFIFNTFPVYNSHHAARIPGGSYFRSTWKRA